MFFSSDHRQSVREHRGWCILYLSSHYALLARNSSRTTKTFVMTFVSSLKSIKCNCLSVMKSVLTSLLSFLSLCSTIVPTKMWHSRRQWNYFETEKENLHLFSLICFFLFGTSMWWWWGHKGFIISCVILLKIQFCVININSFYHQSAGLVWEDLKRIWHRIKGSCCFFVQNMKSKYY